MRNVLFVKSNFRVAHLNICAAGQFLNKAQSIITFFARKKIDIICLSEIKMSKQNRTFFQHKDYNTFFNTPPDPLLNSPKEGIAVLISKNIDPQHVKVQNLSPGRALKVEFKVNEQTFSALCIYAPSQGDSASIKFYETLIEKTNNFENCIVIGDFNVVLDPKLDRRNSNIAYHKPRTHKLLTDYILENAMVDPWRATYPQKQEYSWENRGSASRIDYSLIPAHLYHQVAQTEYYKPPIHTDHKIF